MVRKILPMLLVLVALSLTACGDYGKVEQGRTVKYDTTTTPATAWIIKDNGIVDKKPEYTVLPAHPFQVPTDPREMGAEPFAALRVKLDLDKKEITMYNLESQKFDVLPFELIENHENVSVRRKHPLVFDEATGKARKFPQINEEENTIVIYSRRQETLSTIKLSAEDFARYKGDEWDAGDEVRIYYKEEGKALRFMNVTKTDFTKRK
ncbi:DUF4881 domain-containing protein [Desulfovibrio sp. OttesenSCG-928-G15]|nr:DUF4881 domain-containing protein [Desulfovibrio sp. OttesenSCG-928-G15]